MVDGGQILSHAIHRSCSNLLFTKNKRLTASLSPSVSWETEQLLPALHHILGPRLRHRLPEKRRRDGAAVREGEDDGGGGGGGGGGVKE